MMAPGLLSPGGSLPPNLPSDSIVAIHAEGKEHACGIGKLVGSSEDIRAAGKGVAVEVICWIGWVSCLSLWSIFPDGTMSSLSLKWARLQSQREVLLVMSDFSRRVSMRKERKRFVHGRGWALGLELDLLTSMLNRDDLWKVDSIGL